MLEQLRFPFDAGVAMVCEPLPMVAPERMPATTAAESLTRLITSGTIADELNEPPRRVLRVLATRHDIRPVALAGRTRLYTAAAVARVRHELNAIDARQCRREAR